MTAAEIINVASELDCGPQQSAVTFARMIAEHCARIADEAAGTGDPGASIREAFKP